VRVHRHSVLSLGLHLQVQAETAGVLAISTILLVQLQLKVNGQVPSPVTKLGGVAQAIILLDRRHDLYGHSMRTEGALVGLELPHLLFRTPLFMNPLQQHTRLPSTTVLL
jgi:hypothetical protein